MKIFVTRQIPGDSLEKLNVNGNEVVKLIGRNTAAEFQAFRKIAHDLPAVEDILSGKAPKLTKPGIDIAYMIITNVLYKVRELHMDEVQKRKTKEDTLSDDTCAKFNNFFQYLLDNEKLLGQEILVLPITIASKNYGLIVNQVKMPTIKKIMEKTGELLKQTLINN